MQLTNRCSFAAVALAFSVLVIVACSSQDPGTGGANGTGGKGSGGSSVVGSGGLPATGSGGASDSGGATVTSTGGSSTTGSGGQPLTGSGGSSATGAGGSSAVGTGGVSTTGSGGSVSTDGGGGTVDGGGAIPDGGGAGGKPADGGQDATAMGTDSGSTSNYNPCPAKGTVCRIMPMGDSITEGYRSTGYGGYRAPLFHLSLVDKKSITFVGSAPLHGPATVDGVAFPQENEGIGGRRIQSLVDIVPTTITTNKPHILLLMIGTNDIASGAASMGSQMAALLDKLLAADTQMLVVVATVVPTTTDSKTTTVKAFDDMLPDMVKTRANAGKHIMLVDMYAKFTSNPSWKTVYFKSTDDLHPSDAGYSLMADVWYAGIKSLLP